MLLPRIVGDDPFPPGRPQLLGPLRVGQQCGNGFCQCRYIGFGYQQAFVLMAHDLVEGGDVTGDDGQCGGHVFVDFEG